MIYSTVPRAGVSDNAWATTSAQMERGAGQGAGGRVTDTRALDDLSIDTIRTLAMDAVQAANSGHPGTPMAMAPTVYTVWCRFLRFDPVDPIWPNRDRSVLSLGHVSMLLYSVLHLCGVKAVDAEYERLAADGIGARVVSMPSWELFERQSQDYRDSVLPTDVTARVAVEQASTFGWERYVGLDGAIVGMRAFGASAPLKELQKKFGFTPDRLVATAKGQLERHAR